MADNLESGILPRQPDEEPAPGSGAESDDDVPIARSLRKRKQIKSTELGQKFGVLAIGEAVCRDFGADNGTINAFRREGSDDLYTVRYTDGDQEDLDLEEYNFAYSLWLTEEGWEAEEDDLQAEEVWKADGADAQSEEDDYSDPKPIKLKSPKKVP